jgi:hypothetical protein
MAARLGKVLYWAANTVAILNLVFGLLLGGHGPGPGNFTGAIPYFAAALGAWLFGRACLYVLAGRTAGRTRKCPHCAEFIKHEAIVCKHRGSELVSPRDTIDDFIKQARKAK